MYKNKYLKYKNKYLSLKNQLGGLSSKLPDDMNRLILNYSDFNDLYYE
jgi:hypothetical protein